MILTGFGALTQWEKSNLYISLFLKVFETNTGIPFAKKQPASE